MSIDDILFEFPQKFTPYLIIEWEYTKHTILKKSIFKMGNNLLTAKHAVLNLGTSDLYVIFKLKNYRFTYSKILYLLFLL